MSIGSIYQYFPDKLSLLDALAVRERDRVRDAVRAELGRVTDEAPLTSVIAATIAAAFAAIDGLGPIHHALFHEVADRAGTPDAGRQLRRALEAELAQLLAGRPELREVDAATAAFVIVTTINALAHEATCDGRPARSAIVQEATRLVTRYLAPAA